MPLSGKRYRAHGRGQGCDEVLAASRRGRVGSGGAGPGWYQEAMTCVSCRTGLDHCHGTVLLHVDGGAECTEPDCADAVLARHALVVDCDSIEGGCACEVTAERLAHAS